MLKRIYMEITNICNLSCSFCPKTQRPQGYMTAEAFRFLLGRLGAHAGYVYLHVMGEPLLHPQLQEILQICGENGERVCLTTNGTRLPCCGEVLLSAPALYKVSISLHCAEVNADRILQEDYLKQCWEFCRAAAGQGILCSLRLWNLGGAQQQNEEILAFLRSRAELWEPVKNGSWKLGEKIFLNPAEKFDWPDLQAQPQSTEFCYGLRDQVAVLWDGTVVPCCLDHEGDIPLGNLYQQTMEEILEGPRAKNMYRGFSNRVPAEELCRRCGYATRFNKG